MTITKHAIQRSQQRGIPQNEFDLIMQIGTSSDRPGSATEYVVLKKDKIKAIEFLKKMIQKIDKMEGSAVLTNGNSVVTTYHKKV